MRDDEQRADGDSDEQRQQQLRAQVRAEDRAHLRFQRAHAQSLRDRNRAQRPNADPRGVQQQVHRDDRDQDEIDDAAGDGDRDHGELRGDAAAVGQQRPAELILKLDGDGVWAEGEWFAALDLVGNGLGLRREPLAFGCQRSRDEGTDADEHREDGNDNQGHRETTATDHASRVGTREPRDARRTMAGTSACARCQGRVPSACPSSRSRPWRDLGDRCRRR